MGLDKGIHHGSITQSNGFTAQEGALFMSASILSVPGRVLGTGHAAGSRETKVSPLVGFHHNDVQE